MAAPLPQGGGWFYLTGQGDSVQHHGPFSVDVMKTLFAQDYVTEDALVWAQGEPDWVPLKASHELYAVLAFPDGEPSAKRTKQKAAPQDAQVAELEAELAAAEGKISPGDVEGEADKEPFVDDDGTRFVWDPSLNRFRPEAEDASVDPVSVGPGGAGAVIAGKPETLASLPEYKPDDMVFVPDDEPALTLEEALAEEEKSREVAEALRDGTGPVPSGATAARTAPLPGASNGEGARERAAPAEDAPGEGAAAGQADGASSRKRLREHAGKGHSRAAGEASGVVPEPQDKAKVVKNTNTSIYVTGIADDATVEEVAEVFQRCGIIREDDERQPRIKLYRDHKTGLLKGDALIIFLQRASVNLAIKVMNGRPFRPGRSEAMTVQEATFQARPGQGSGQASSAAAPASSKGGGGGGGGGGGKKKPAPGQKHTERLLGWGGFDDVHKVTVLVSGLFTIEEMTLSPDLEEELQDYLVARCKDLGAIDKVKLYRKSPAGVATIKFRLPDAAAAALARLGATVKLRHLLPDLASALDATLVTEVAEDIAMKCAEVGLAGALDRTAEAGAAQVLRASAQGGVMVAFTDDSAARLGASTFKGLTYDGRALDACVLYAVLWDGKTPPAKFGQDGAEDEAERLEAYARELERGA